MNTYGELPNYTLLHVYGFVLQDNPCDAVRAASAVWPMVTWGSFAGVCGQDSSQISLPAGGRGGGECEEEEEVEEVGAAWVDSRWG